MITYLIIGITVVLSFICFSNRELFMKLAFIPYRTIRNHEYYRIVTHGFIHADMTHLLVNMFTFWSFGLYIERTFRYMGFGKGAYLALYFGGMIVASLYDLTNDVMIRIMSLSVRLERYRRFYLPLYS